MYSKYLFHSPLLESKDNSIRKKKSENLNDDEKNDDEKEEEKESTFDRFSKNFGKAALAASGLYLGHKLLSSNNSESGIIDKAKSNYNKFMIAHRAANALGIK